MALPAQHVGDSAYTTAEYREILAMEEKVMERIQDLMAKQSLAWALGICPLIETVRTTLRRDSR